jgi:hypothetical protein
MTDVDDFDDLIGGKLDAFEKELKNMAAKDYQQK